MRRLRGHLPELLAGLGALLALGIVLAVLLTRHEGPPVALEPSTTAAPSTPTTTTTTTTTPATTAPAPSGAPSNLRLTSLTPSSATLAWNTSVPSVGRVVVGTPALGPTRWLAAAPAAVDHEVTIPGLAFSTDYRVWVSSAGVDGDATLDFTPPPPASTVAASTSRGTILIDGAPWFPFMVYGACSTYYPSLLADGITLFAQNPCGGMEAQLPALTARALSAGVAGTDDPPGAPGRIGAFYPDEADASGARADSLPAVAQPGLSLLTLSNHVFSGASPPPGGREIYPGLIARTDVVGLDLYPLQGWCRRERLVEVYDAQRELIALAAPRPTFQWIEAAGMNCPTDATVAVTPDTVRAEAWLAIVGGARGLGFFPAAWTGDVGGAVARVAGEVGALLPALVEPPARVEVRADGGAVRAAAWSYAGAVYIAAVNAGTAATGVTLRLPELAGRSVLVLGEQRRLRAADGSLGDRLEPLQVHLYAAPPAG
jgi:hypothetical protein